jgi:hypothetical protein
MGMFDMVRGWLSGGGKQEAGTSGTVDNVGMAHVPDEIDGLDFKKAIDAHMQWKDRLRGAIDGNSGEQLDVTQIACDDRCVLGQWIHGMGAVAHGHLPQFTVLREHHAEFHVCAAGVLAEAQAGHAQEAQRQLSGVYSKVSEQVKHDLIRFYLDLSKAQRQSA